MEVRRLLLCLPIASLCAVPGCGKQDSSAANRRAITAAGTAHERVITVEVGATSPAWDIAIERIVVVEDELWVVSSMTLTDSPGPAVTCRIKGSETVNAPELPVRHFVLGPTWRSGTSGPMTYIDDMGDIPQAIESGEILYAKSDLLT